MKTVFALASVLSLASITAACDVPMNNSDVAVVAIALKATINTAVALWSSSAILAITNLSSEGFNSQALQQGGVGLLMTVLIISAPPMAGMLFNGTLANFTPYAAVGGGVAGGMGRPGPQGQPAGSYNWTVPPTSAPNNSGGKHETSAFGNSPAHPNRSYVQAPTNKDEMKYKS